MVIHLRLGIVAAVSAFLIASAVPAAAQRGHGSGSGPRGGASAAPRSPQGPGPSAGARQPHGPGPSASARQPQGPGPSAGARPPQGPRPGGGGRPVTGPGYRPGPGARPGPGYRPGSGYRPGYGSRGYYPRYGYRGYGYRGYYPWYGYGGGYYPGYYSGFSFGFGAYGWPYYYGGLPYAAYGYYGSSFDSGYGYGGGASLKVEVQPKTAEVYVDGQLAGIVDQFDGMFQSLSVEPGGHEITIYHEGFRSIRQQLYLSAGSTQRIKGAMAQLAPGEPNEPRPQPAQGQPEPQYQMVPQYSSPQPQYPGPQPQYRSPQPQGPPPDRPAPDSNPPLPGNSRFGQVAIRVQPADAEVLVDGERWRNPDGAERLLVYLSPGTHRVEIRKDGYDPFVTAVEIKRGEVTPLNVSLARF